MQCTRPQCLSTLFALIAFSTTFTSSASAEIQNAQLNLRLRADISPDPQFPNTAIDSDSDSQFAPVSNLSAEVPQTLNAGIDGSIIQSIQSSATFGASQGTISQTYNVNYNNAGQTLGFGFSINTEAPAFQMNFVADGPRFLWGYVGTLQNHDETEPNLIDAFTVQLSEVLPESIGGGFSQVAYWGNETFTNSLAGIQEANLIVGNTYQFTINNAAGYGGQVGTGTFGYDIDFAWSTSGEASANPLLPISDGGNFIFNQVVSGQWYDPPAVEGYEFVMTSGSLFTSILNFPPGFAGLFTVLVDDIAIGEFGPGDIVDFSNLPGGGVSAFKITGIQPLVDADDPTAFPIQLAFNTALADFTMTPITAIPEPSTFVLAAFGLAASACPFARQVRRAAK